MMPDFTHVESTSRGDVDRRPRGEPPRTHSFLDFKHAGTVYDHALGFEMDDSPAVFGVYTLAGTYPGRTDGRDGALSILHLLRAQGRLAVYASDADRFDRPVTINGEKRRMIVFLDVGSVTEARSEVKRIKRIVNRNGGTDEMRWLDARDAARKAPSADVHMRAPNGQVYLCDERDVDGKIRLGFELLK